MNPVQFYLSKSRDLDSLDFEPLEATSRDQFNADGQEGNALVFEAPAELGTGALYRASGDRLQIASLFGAVSLPLGSLRVGEEIELSNLSPLEHSTWPISLSQGWADALGRAPIQNDMQAAHLGANRFAPVFSPTQMHLSVGGRKEWVVIFLPEPSGSISKTRGGGAEINTPSGLIFEIPPGRGADLLLAGKVQWGLPGDLGAFVLGDLPW